MPRRAGRAARRRWPAPPARPLRRAGARQWLHRRHGGARAGAGAHPALRVACHGARLAAGLRACRQRRGIGAGRGARAARRRRCAALDRRRCAGGSALARCLPRRRWRRAPMRWPARSAPTRPRPRFCRRPCAREAAEARYAALFDEMAARIDPRPHDPGRATTPTPAQLALTAGCRRVGGLPPVPVGEDRALFAALARMDARIRHAPEASVTVSARLPGGRAAGVADAARPAARPGRRDAGCAARAAGRGVPACPRTPRCAAFQRQPAAAGDPRRLARALGIAPARLDALLALPRFGLAWEALQAEAPALAHRRALDAAALPAETRYAAAFVTTLHIGAQLARSASAKQVEAVARLPLPAQHPRDRREGVDEALRRRVAGEGVVGRAGPSPATPRRPARARRRPAPQGARGPPHRGSRAPPTNRG